MITNDNMLYLLIASIFEMSARHGHWREYFGDNWSGFVTGQMALLSVMNSVEALKGSQSTEPDTSWENYPIDFLVW